MYYKVILQNFLQLNKPKALFVWLPRRTGSNIQYLLQAYRIKYSIRAPGTILAWKEKRSTTSCLTQGKSKHGKLKT
jgi:hypothetical protein